jgi:DNA (cytosine-5)-methyltransferase 1
VLGRTAPPPTEPGTRGQPRLSAALVEWMMGLPSGWVTGPDLGLTRTAQLHALGNGVVPQQSSAAVRHLLAEAASADLGGAAWV